MGAFSCFFLGILVGFGLGASFVGGIWIYKANKIGEDE